MKPHRSPSESRVGLAALIGAAVFALALGAAAARAQAPVVAKLRNYSVTPGFYDPPHDKQMKSLLRGDEAEPQGGGFYLLTGVKLETFREEGTRELLVETPQCVYDSGRRSVSSSKTLKAQTADGKFLIEGEGFLWQQTNSSLLISNRVHTVIHPELLDSPASTPSTPTPGDLKEVEIFADQFEYASEPGLGVYRGNVRVSGTNLAVNSALLTFHLPMAERQLQSIAAEQDIVADYEGLHATGQRAVYTVSTGLLDVTGNPAWTHGQREGRSRQLVIDRTNKIYRALGEAYLKMPAQGGGAAFLPTLSSTATNASTATNQFVEIRCDHYEIRTNVAFFHDQVRVRELAGEELRGEMTCSQVTATFIGTNELQTLLAQTNVVIQQETQRLLAGQAFYTATNGLLELTQNPQWQAGPRQGRGQLILIDVPRQEMTVRGQALMQLPVEELGQASGAPGTRTATPRPRGAAEPPAEVASEQYRVDRQSARFEGDVRVAHPRINLTCQQMTVRFPPEGERDQSLLADQRVDFVLTSEEGQQVHGRGDQVLYTYNVTPTRTNDILKLMGSPVLETTNATFRAPFILFDRAENKLFAPAKYQVRALATNAPTTRLKWPIK